MFTAKQNWIVGFHAGFYWIGLLMTLACLTFVLAGNRELLYRFEHTRFPLSWAFAGLAVFAFLAAERCHPADSHRNEAEDESPALAGEWETVEV